MTVGHHTTPPGSLIPARYGPGCERHNGDPHNLCEACWALEPPAALEARADALVEYGNALPEGVTTEAFAEAANLRRVARTPQEWRPLGLLGTLRFLVSRTPRAASWRHFGFELNVERVPGGNAVWIERRR